MLAFYIFLFLSAAGLIVSGVSAVLITNELNKRGVETPVLFFRMNFLKYMEMYKKMTLAETGKVGRFFYAYIIAINSTWIFALAAFFASKTGS
jgi:hypothetical protein